MGHGCGGRGLLAAYHFFFFFLSFLLVGLSRVRQGDSPIPVALASYQLSSSGE